MFCIYLDLIYEHIYVARFQNEIKFIFDKKKIGQKYEKRSILFDFERDKLKKSIFITIN